MFLLLLLLLLNQCMCIVTCIVLEGRWLNPVVCCRHECCVSVYCTRVTIKTDPVYVGHWQSVRCSQDSALEDGRQRAFWTWILTSGFCLLCLSQFSSYSLMISAFTNNVLVFFLLKAALKKYQMEHKSKGESLEKCQGELKKLRRKSQGSKNPSKYGEKELQVSPHTAAGREQS